MRNSVWISAAAFATLSTLCAAGLHAQSALPLDRLKLPPGFGIEVVARAPGARAMTWGATGDRGATLFVGSTQGSVYAVSVPAFGPSASNANAVVHTIARGLNIPLGVAYKDGALYVSAVSRVVRFDGIDSRLDNPPAMKVVRDTFPSETHHGGKYLAFGPDGYLYVPVGAPCNICDPDSNRYANIMRMKPDGSDLQVFARGVRNTVGFDWHPQTHELWFTDNGRDMLGDDLPPDELNHAPRAGMHFGFPYCHGGTIPDPEFGKAHPCSEFTAPAQRLGPHVASLGMKFYTGSQFPAKYRNQIIIAEHGSWNRSAKIGYRLTLVTLDGSKATSYEPFVEGWLQGQSAWGRPVDVLVAPDGSLFVSDDHAGAIYRIRYAPK